MVQAYKGRFKRIESGIWMPSRENKHKGQLLVGKVSDIKHYEVNDNSGELELVDIHPGGYNTISSGASHVMLSSMFWPNSSYTGTGTNAMKNYIDANGFYFPGYGQMAGNPAGSADGVYWALFRSLFGSVWGIKGGSAGLASHATTVASAIPAWALWSNGTNYGEDWGGAQTAFSFANEGMITNTATNTIYGGGGANSNIPATSWNITVTSGSAAQSYTVDSIGWCPTSFNPSVPQAVFGYWSLTTTGVPSLTTSAVTWASSSATPATLNNLAVSALYVLPYVVTVNASGALQFTYTFQGA